MWNDGIDRDSAAYNFASSDARYLRVIAGPGTGKSFGLNRRIARLLEEGIDPKKILAVTFTRTSAQDLKNEIQSIGIDEADSVVVKTLHGLCFGLLHKESIIEKTQRHPRPLLDYEKKPMLCDINSTCDNTIRKKEKRLAAFEAAWARLQSDTPGFPNNEDDRQFGEEVNKWLKCHKAMLFGEMIIEALHYLRNNPMCEERRIFSHILVDEYQDLNKSEQAVIDLLATNSNLAIIGDDDQSIYSFKCANPEGIRKFPDNHPDCRIVDFDYCRRCPKKVVTMASRLISKNPNRTLGDLHAFDSNQDGNVEIIQWPSLSKEIKGISDIVHNDILSGNINPEDVLILTPNRIIGYKIRDELSSNGINAKSYFRESALNTKELRYAFSLLTLSANPNDMVALRFLLGYNNQTYRAASYKHILDYSLSNNITILEVLKKCASGEIEIPRTSSIIQQYTKIQTDIARLFELAQVDNTLFLDFLAKENEDNRIFRELLIEAINSVTISKEENLVAWVKEIYTYALDKISFPETTNEHDHVRIMSLHASKGLSAKYVIVMSAIDELIPKIDHDSDISEDRQIEEQRRLFYVAITRCKSSSHGYPGKLIISSFVSLPGSTALQMKTHKNIDPYKPCRVSASRFIRDFEETAPQTTIPSV